MYTLGFSLIWTVLMTIGVAYICARGDFPGDSTLIQLIMALMPLVGVFFTWHSVRTLRRFRSVRKDGDEFVWSEVNGCVGSSATDSSI